MGQKDGFSVNDRRGLKGFVEASEIPQMGFGDAMKEVVKGRQTRRLEWQDGRVRLAIVEERLMIFVPSDGMFHPLVVSAGDIAGEDWVVAEEISTGQTIQ